MLCSRTDVFRKGRAQEAEGKGCFPDAEAWLRGSDGLIGLEGKSVGRHGRSPRTQSLVTPHVVSVCSLPSTPHAVTGSAPLIANTRWLAGDRAHCAYAGRRPTSGIRFSLFLCWCPDFLPLLFPARVPVSGPPLESLQPHFPSLGHIISLRDVGLLTPQ